MLYRKLLAALIAAILLMTTMSCVSDETYGDSYDDEEYSDEIYEEEEYLDTFDEEETDEEETDEPDTGDTTQDISACNILLTDLFESSDGDDSDDEGEEDDTEYILITYQVHGDALENPQLETVSDDLLDEQQDRAGHQEMWELFARTIPADRRTLISEFIVFTDGPDNVLAAVDQLSTEPEAWSLEVDIADADNIAMLIGTLIHEHAHILTLNNSQFLPEAASCPFYQSDDNCAEEDSYLNLFYERFWTDIYAEWDLAYDDEDALAEFYETYSDQFVTEYASTDPDEDIAETWLYFVYGPRPAGATIAEEKILFFYEFPELVQLRDEIRSNLCNYVAAP
ncbi:MAG: hypothetical protein JXB85_14320 [Anaerolineales bacterium]|nr:hypothetical protein [Anaerolineales bacterium]